MNSFVFNMDISYINYRKIIQSWCSVVILNILTSSPCWNFRDASLNHISLKNCSLQSAQIYCSSIVVVLLGISSCFFKIKSAGWKVIKITVIGGHGKSHFISVKAAT